MVYDALISSGAALPALSGLVSICLQFRFFDLTLSDFYFL